jgi:hypothetical protein
LKVLKQKLAPKAGGLSAYLARSKAADTFPIPHTGVRLAQERTRNVSLPAPSTSRRTCLDRLTDVAGQTEIVLHNAKATSAASDRHNNITL